MENLETTQENISKEQKHRSFIGIVVVLIGFVMFVPSQDPRSLVTKNSQLETKVSPYETLSLDANAFIVFDVVEKKVLHAQNEDAQLPLASLTKIMTALIASDSMGGERVISIPSASMAKEGDTGLLVGEFWKVKDLIDLTLMTSSNDGASALAAAVYLSEEAVNNEVKDIFAQKIKEKVKEVEMNQTYFINESGLDISEFVSGAYGSAHDVAKLISYVMLYHPSLLEATTHTLQDITSESGVVHHVTNTNKIIETLPGVIASKTGFTEIAGGNLAVAFEAGPGRPIVVVVLGSTLDNRFSDVEQLIWATLEYLNR